MAEENGDKPNLNFIFICLIVILLIALGAQYFYFNGKKTQSVMGTSNNSSISPNAKRLARNRMMMDTAVTPPALSDQQKAQLLSTAKQKTFNITGGNYYFAPSKISVNKGDAITFVMTNAGGVHNFIIDELGIKTKILKTGEAESVTFTASKSGSFIFYCGLPGHRQKGMWGTLEVK